MADIHALSLGQVVFSKCGRDKGLPFIITGLEGEYAFLVDGEVRKLEKPKKKKIKHLQPVKHIEETVGNKMTERRHVENADFRTALVPFKRSENSKEDCPCRRKT